VTAKDEGEALWSVGALILVKTDSEQTDGAFSLVDHTAAPGYETPYHVHHREDELFYILEGAIDCSYGDDGAETVHAGPGDTVFLPRDVPHGFRVVSDEPCRMLIQLAPGGFEKFFLAAGEPAGAMETPPAQEPDVQALVALGAEYGLDILGPLPS
jgi:mannose-6-phosphate isomerase-like protein (cupin superfamily)